MDFLIPIVLPGVILLCIGVVLHWKTYKLRTNGALAEGEVVEVVERKSSTSDFHKLYFYPIVGFETKSGQSIRKELNIGTNPNRYPVGRKLSIIYDSTEPENVKINTKLYTTILPWIFTSVGIILLMIAGILYWNSL